MEPLDEAKYQAMRSQILKALIAILPTLKSFCTCEEGRRAAKEVEAHLIRLEEEK